MKDGRQAIVDAKNEKIIEQANALLLKQAKELEETKDALERCRWLLASEKELVSRLTKQLENVQH